MAFDIAGAREAGYSDLEIANHLSRGADFDVQGAIDAGYSPLEIINHLNPEEETTVLGATGEFLKGIPRGFASSFATAGQGLTELADAGLNLVGLEDAITDEDTQAVAGYVESFQNALREGPLGADPAYSDAFATKFGEGLGSFASFLVPGGVLKGAAQLGKVSKAKEAAAVYGGTGTLAVGTGAGQQAQRIEAARDRGIEISPEIEDQSIGLGAIIGLSELAPLERVLKAIPKSQLSGIIPRIESAVKTGGLEAVQELGAGLAQDFTERGMYNPDLEIGESAWDDLTIGGAVGATADLLVNYAAGRKAKSAEQLRQEAELEEETLRREGQEGFEAGIRAEETAKKERAEEVDRTLEEIRQEARESIGRTPLEVAIDYRQDNGKDISRAELEFNAGPLEDSVYNEILNQAREAETVTPILALPSPDQRKLAAQEAVQERMKKLGLSESVQTKVVDVIRKVRTDEQGNLIFEADATVEDSDSFGSYMPTAKVIQLSIDQVFADARGQPVTEETVVNSLTKTLNHEVYHAIRNLDLVTQEEVELLEGLARKYRKKGTEGADGQPLTYASWAEQGYSDLNSAKMTEEAVAELISDSLAGEVIADGQTITIGGKPRNIIQRIVDFFKSMVGFTSSARARDFSDFIGKLDSGEVGVRERGEIRTPYLTDYARAEKMKRGVGKQRLADQPIVQLEEEDVESRRVGRPDVAVRPEVERAYQQFQAGEINRGKYDAVVRGTISEYDFVPQPATTQEMFGALDKNKKEKINLPIEEASEVGLRLDIPAYTNHGVWVPTIHAKGKASHRATAAINNADFTRTSQAKAQRVMEGGAKSPFAQIKGNFVNRTDAENEAIAQQALSDPAWTQVGFDPRRHSYFYDRKTGEAVTTAEEVVQVGPLVLAKNAVKDPIFQEETLYSKRYTGAPAGLESPQKLGGLRRVIKGLAQEGEPGRFWYERSGKALLDITGGDKEKAKRLAQAIAITSPQTPVPTNFDYAVQAYYQHEAGQPIKTGMFPTAMADKLEEVFSGKDWEGRKTNNFYNNVMRSIDPTIAQGVTTDLWMMRAFGYKGDAPTDAQYTFVEEEVKRLADELGWEPQQVQAAVWVAMKARTEAKPVREETEKISERLGYMTYVPKPGTKKLERKILDEDGHRSVWLGQALKYDPTRAEKEDSKFDFEDAAKNNLAQISWESIPGRTTGHMPQVFDADYSVLQNYHVDISKAFLDADGNDIVARELGVLSPGDFEAPGYFEGRVSPGTQTQVVAPKKYKSLSLADIDSLERKGEVTADEANQMRAERIEPSAEDLMAAYAAVRGILMKQDGVGYHKPFTNKSLRKKDLNGFDIDIGRPLSEKETAQLAELLAEASGHGEYNPIASDTGARLINFDYLGTDNNDFNNMVVKSLARMEFDNGESFSANRFAASAGYVGNDWSVDTNGEGYIRNIEGRSSDLSGRVRDLVGQLQPRIQAVDQEYAGKYGWAVNPDINRTFADGATGRGNLPNYAGTVEGSLFRDGRLALSHFSNQKRIVLDPSKAGTGADRTKRNRPTNAVWLGVTKAKTDPYVKEPMLGMAEGQYAVDLADVYIADDRSNPLVPRDPERIWSTNPDGSIDYDETLGKARKKGYKGILVNSPQHGKVVLWSEPLNILDEQMQSRRTPKNIRLTTRKHPPQKVEEAVVKDEILAEDMQGFPRVNFQAESNAQYVAQDPDAGYEPQFDESQLASRRTPDRSQSYEGSIDAVLGDRPVGPTQYETYQEATGEGKLDYWLTKFKQGAINRFARLEALNRDPALRDNLADSSSIAAALFADRSRGVVSAAIKHGVPVYRNGITKVEDFSHNGVQYRGLIDLMGKLYSQEHGDLTKDAQAYAIAKRGKRLEAKSGKPAPLDAKQRQEIILNAEKYLDENGRSIIKDWYDAWQAYNNYTIRFLKDTGVLNNETATLWQEYSDYVPFYRAAAGEGNAPAIAQRVFGGDLTAKAHIKEYKGSKDKIDVPLTEAIGLNLTAAIEMGMRNVAQQRIIRDMQTIGLAKQLKKGEAATADLVTLKVDGKEVRFDVYDPLVFESMQSLPDQGFLVNNVFGAPARFLREMITRDPGFMMVNMLRDTLSTFTTSGSNFVPVVDTLRGYADGMDTLERTGVVGGYDYSNDPDNVVKFYQKEMKRRGIGPEGGRGSPLGMFTSIWDALGNATTRSDAATRNAVYKDVLARTGNEAEANFQALEVINFSRRGANALARVLTATIPFLNARFQGLDVFYRAGKGEYTANKELSRRQAIQSFVTRAGMLTALTALYYTLVSDDDQYKEQSEEIRDNNWIIPTASGVPVKIPIPFEVGLVFKTIPETILAATVGDKSSKEARDTIQRGIVSTLEINPLGIQAISPLVEASMNHSFYTGRDIVPYYIDANVATGLQDRVSTTEMGKFIGSELGISPIKVDHVMTGYSGTLGGYVLSAVDAILRSEAVTGDEAAKMPALKIYEYPVIKRFFASEQGSGLRQDAYELYREINKVVTTSNKLKKEGRLEELNSYLSSKQHLLDLKSPVYNIKGKLDQSRRSRDAIMRMDIDPERKREMIDDIDENINEMLKVIPALKKRADLPAFESGLAQRITGG